MVIEATTVERLQELLDANEEKNAELQNRVRDLERLIDGAPDGWRFGDEPLDDTGRMPVPRLELAYFQLHGDWREYKVVYRLVYRHLLGQLTAIPLGVTTSRSGLDAKPAEFDLPYRDGAHARHDAEHLGLPLFRVMPGEVPVSIDDKWDGYEQQRRLGRGHRSDGK